MREANIFSVDWDTGGMRVIISEFFTDANVPQVKKLFKLAKQYSTEQDRKGLLLALIQEDRNRKELLDALGELSYKKSKLANDFYHMTAKPEVGWAEKRVYQERVKLARAINILKAERWDE
jgi:hypothetical protein